MVIKEISLCEAGMNDHSRVVIVKAREPFDKNNASALEAARETVLEMLPGLADKLAAILVAKAQTGGVPVNKQSAADSAAAILETLMDIETLAKSLEEAEGRIETITKQAEQAAADLTAAQATIAKQTAQIEELKKAANPPSDEDVMKGLPEPVRKRLLAAEADAKSNKEALAKMADEKELAEAVSKAKAIGVPNADAVGALMVRVAKGKTTAEDSKTIEGLLKSAAEVEKASLLFKSLGHHGAVDGDPEVLMKAKAEEIRKAKPEMTEAQAFDAALQANPELYAAYQAKRRTSHPA